uniref:Uncharacterized protein n=1 Tax=Ditylum brightwellii TaxID=49249 RepID=A0A6V2I0C6_9STRA
MWWKRLLHKDLTIAAAALILSATLAYYSASGVFSSNDRLGGRDERSIMTMASTTNDASTSCSSCSVRLYQGLSPSTGHVESEINRMRATVATPHGCNAEIEHVILNTHEQRSFLEKHGMECFVEKDRSDGGIPGKNNPALEKYDELVNIGMQYMAHELWKYCALSSTPDATNNNKETYVAYLDAESPLLSIFSDIFLQPSPKRCNYAVIGSNALLSGTVHSSFLFLTPLHTSLARTVMRLMIGMDSTILDTSPLLHFSYQKHFMH